MWDTPILGCTHYPHRPHHRAGHGADVTLIDLGRETALVGQPQPGVQSGLLRPRKAAGGTDYYVSDLPEGFEAR